MNDTGRPLSYNSRNLITKLENVKSTGRGYTILVISPVRLKQFDEFLTGYLAHDGWFWDASVPDEFIHSGPNEFCTVGTTTNKCYDSTLGTNQAKVAPLLVLVQQECDRKYHEDLHTWEQAYQSWENISSTEWEGRLIDRHGQCPSCNGVGDKWEGGYDYTGGWVACSYCDGTGQVNAMMLREYHKPNNRPENTYNIKGIAKYRAMEQKIGRPAPKIEVYVKIKLES